MIFNNCYSVGPDRNKHNIYKINAAIVLGNPQTEACNGVGICRLFPQPLHKSPQVKYVTGYFIFFSDSSVEMHIPRSAMEEQFYCRHFEGNRFIIQSELKWPLWMQKKLPASSAQGIPPGVYECLESNYEIIVLFR